MNFTFKNLLSVVAVFVFLSCNGQKVESQNWIGKERISYENQVIRVGAENYKTYLSLFGNKKIGIVTNQTGIVIEPQYIINTALPTPKDKITSIDTLSIVDLLLYNNVNIQKIYAPEHGFRGTADAGELIKDGKDTKTGLPIISLYGNNKKPTKEQLSGIDIMVFDLQDVGARFYTYISSLHYVMEACAENNIPLIVLDRPNPNGSIVDGPTLELENKSFVGMHPIPVLHGMTIGEYAKMINGEKWLKNEIQCDLTVIPCLNYKRDMPYSLPVPPSPNLPNDKAVNLYASLCFFEGTNVSVGRGTDKQFQIYGSPYLPKEVYSIVVQKPHSDRCETDEPVKLYRELSRDEVKNYNIETLEKETLFSFVPKPNLGAKDPLYNGKTCYGRDLSQMKVSSLYLGWLIDAYNKTEDKSKFFNNFFVKLAGTKKLQQQIEQGLSETEIRKTWEKDLDKFKKIRQKYLIYN